ncbi:unnamed protein product [Mycena citricolor]|uniref:RTA1-domain-containing protein n=1 Tax=Mycena citricolor TaxID=2018698 RepID=A0AAD2Q3Z2_9AGAR|nr:unnamed protein product [Mycena citricolor]
MPRFALLLTFAACFVAAFAAELQVVQRDSSADTPIGGYVPKKSLSIIGAIAYGTSAMVLWTQFFSNKPKHPFMLSLNFGMSAMAAGFVLRYMYATPPFTLGKYIAWDMLILLSPCLFLATDYMLLSRLVNTFDPQIVDRCLFIKPTRVVKIFVWSDVLTFFLQSSGGGLTASHSASMANLGSKIGLIGLILQAASFLLFTFLVLTFASRVATHYPHIWNPKTYAPVTILSTEPLDDWRILVFIMSVTCVGILTRSVFRVAEYAGGYDGRIATHEAYFYLLDALPLLLTMSLYALVWPTRFFHPPTEKLGRLRGSSQDLLKMQGFRAMSV